MARARSNPVAQSGKCSTLLDYLDTVSEDTPRRGYKKSVPRVPDMFNTGTSMLSLSSTSPQQRRRRRRRHADGEESKLGEGEARAPWDNSTKDTAMKTASSTRDHHRGMLSVSTDQSSRGAGGSGQRCQPSTTRGRREAANDSMAPRKHRDVGNHHYSATTSGDPSSLSSVDRMANSGVNCASSKQALDYSRSTAGPEAPTTTVGATGQQQRRQWRWVWDEWDDNNMGCNPAPPSYSRDQTTGSSGSRTSSNGSPAQSCLSPSARTVTVSVGESSRSKRDKNKAPVDSDDDGDDEEGTPAARLAFEDIQATAQSMKANLKQQRSEVCEHTIYLHSSLLFVDAPTVSFVSLCVRV